ncbi:MAG: hypothetical protein U5J95_12280 [Balneolaceae bacterium]|nr:hypothetical protein [Balneolaceae bacterium]
MQVGEVYDVQKLTPLLRQLAETPLKGDSIPALLTHFSCSLLNKKEEEQSPPGKGAEVRSRVGKKLALNTPRPPFGLVFKLASEVFSE